jgi:hypothetical protein
MISSWLERNGGQELQHSERHFRENVNQSRDCSTPLQSVREGDVTSMHSDSSYVNGMFMVCLIIYYLYCLFSTARCYDDKKG